MTFHEWCDANLRADWRKGWRFISLRSAALQGALLIAWAQMPDDLKNALPSWLLPTIAGFCLFVGTAGVFYKQKGLQDGSDK